MFKQSEAYWNGKIDGAMIKLDETKNKVFRGIEERHKEMHEVLSSLEETLNNDEFNKMHNECQKMLEDILA